MRAKRRVTGRLTRKKTRSRTKFSVRPGASTQPARATDDDYGTPTDDEWANMSRYESFVVHDADDDSYQFDRGQFAIIVPHDCPPDTQMSLEDYWVGRIKEVRSREDDPSEVWVKVQWYWSAGDVAERLLGVDPESYGKMERFRSNSYDYVHSTCFQFYADVALLNETSLQQPHIAIESFYYRYNFNIILNTITPKLYTSCLCKKPYVPHKDLRLHFCPRNGCKKAYHTSCLEDAGWVEPAHQAGTRGYRLERTTPDSSVALPAPSGSRIKREQPAEQPLFMPVDEPRKRGRGRGLSVEPKLEDFDISIIDYSAVPNKLLVLARSPMVKGTDDFGVVGNISVVAEARQIVNDMLVRKKALPSDWQKRLQEYGGIGIDVFAWVADDLMLKCPSCRGAI